ncbi:MAG TPA: hypothetical protein PK961_13040 [bacterium]|nr:hypothetical protein [bacterium]
MDLPAKEPDMAAESPVIQRAFEWASGLDEQQVRNDLEQLRAKHPQESPEELAWRLIRAYRRQGVSAGFLTGLPANPWLALPASAADVAAMIHLEMRLAARIALLYEPDFFQREDARYELLVPVFGSEVVHDIVKRFIGNDETAATRSMIERVFNKESMKAIRSLLLKHFAVRITRKALFAKMIPVVGGFIGGTVNYLEMREVGRRIIDYFSDKQNPNF